MSSEIELTGKVTKRTYFNKETNFAIFEIKVGVKLYTIKGNVDFVERGDNVTCTGIMVIDPKFGEQMKMSKFLNIPPTDRSNIIMYLMNSGIAGLGQRTCINIYETFGAQTFEIIDNNPEELYKVPKIKKELVVSIIESWRENRSQHIIRNQLISIGFTGHQAQQILQFYQKINSIDFIKNNPYVLLSQATLNLKFELVDSIALKLGISKTNPERLTAGTEFAIRDYMRRSGDTIMEYNEFIQNSRKLLGISNSEIEEFLRTILVKNFYIEEDKRNNVKYVQLMMAYHYESSIAKKIAFIKRHASSPISHWKKLLKEAQTEKGHFLSGFTLTDEQTFAIETAINNNICIINGGPGVGKTTTLDLLLTVLKKSGLKVKLCAPTGKAAKKMQESTKEVAKTIHSTLGYTQGGFSFNSIVPLECDVIVIDEYSMVDLRLTHHLFDAINVSTKVIIVGDINQLASIGPGSVLKDMISSNIIPVASITKIQRQAASSKIIVNSHRVNNGLMPEDKITEYEGIEMKNDFFFLRTRSDNDTLKMINDILGTKRKEGRVYNAYRELKGDETTFNVKDNCQLLTPIHSTLVGTAELNRLMQDCLNPDTGSTPFIDVGERVFRYNDNVMHTKNDPENNVYNGDAGFVNMVVGNKNDSHKFLETTYKDVDGDEFKVKYTPAKIRDELMLSYAITIHKAQGSEYPVVIIPIPHGFTPNLDRSLIYTAITRGKHLVIMIGSESNLAKGISNISSRIRKTRLSERIVKEYFETMQA